MSLYFVLIPLENMEIGEIIDFIDDYLIEILIYFNIKVKSFYIANYCIVNKSINWCHMPNVLQ